MGAAWRVRGDGRRLSSGEETSAFQQHHVAPTSIHATEPRSFSHDPEARLGVEGDAGTVFREDARL